MPVLRDLEIGVMMWAGRDSVAEMKSLGARCGQLGIAGDVDLRGAVAQWKAELEREADQFVPARGAAGQDAGSLRAMPVA